MMRKTIGLVLISMTMIAVSSWGEPELFRHLDVSDGNHEGHWVMFFSKGMAPNSPIGNVGAAVGKGDNLEAAFGMAVKNSRPVLGAVTIEEINALRDDESAPATIITLIDVSPEQFKAAKAAVDGYIATEEHLDTPPNVAMNVAFDVFKNLPMKRPYRSGLGSTTVMTFYTDIGQLNRKLAK